MGVERQGLRRPFPSQAALDPTAPRVDRTTVSKPARWGEVDAFVSHSWSDDARAKHDALDAWRRVKNKIFMIRTEEAHSVSRKEPKRPRIERARALRSVLFLSQAWRSAFVARVGREPRVWIDVFCIDQDRDVRAQLAVLPAYLAACDRLLVLKGPTYLDRLWCVMELFVFFAMGAPVDRIDLRVLDDDELGDATGLDQCPGNPEKPRGFRTLEASISVGFQSMRLLLGPLIISARVLEIWTHKLLASTRAKSC